jgi:GT2 family glycosyltransferase
MKAVSDFYIRNKTNRGYGPAVNQGIEASSSHWIVVSNNDIEILDNWIEQAQHAWIDGIGAISSHLLDHDPKRRVGIEEAPKGHMFGALWMTRREVINRVGILDERYQMGMFEDRDLWERIEQAGYRFRKVGHVNHVGNASWGKLKGQHEIYVHNKQLFESRWV